MNSRDQNTEQEYEDIFRVTFYDSYTSNSHSQAKLETLIIILICIVFSVLYSITGDMFLNNVTPFHQVFCQVMTTSVDLQKIKTGSNCANCCHFLTFPWNNNMKTHCEDYLRGILHILWVAQNVLISLVLPFAMPLAANKSSFKTTCE